MKFPTPPPSSRHLITNRRFLIRPRLIISLSNTEFPLRSFLSFFLLSLSLSTTGVSLGIGPARTNERTSFFLHPLGASDNAIEAREGRPLLPRSVNNEKMREKKKKETRLGRIPPADIARSSIPRENRSRRVRTRSISFPTALLAGGKGKWHLNPSYNS